MQLYCIFFKLAYWNVSNISIFINVNSSCEVLFAHLKHQHMASNKKPSKELAQDNVSDIIFSTMKAWACCWKITFEFLRKCFYPIWLIITLNLKLYLWGVIFSQMVKVALTEDFSVIPWYSVWLASYGG